MRKLPVVVFIVLLFLLMMPLDGFAQDEQVTVFYTFDQQNYHAQDEIIMTIHVKDYADLYGFQIDIEENFSDYTFLTTTSHYQMSENAIFYQDEILVNGEADDVATLMVKRPSSETVGYTYTTKTVLATIHLVAVRAIEDPYTLFDLSDDLNDLLYGDSNIIIKLSNASGEALPYTYNTVLPDPIITLNPGIDTIDLGQEHEDAGITVLYMGSHTVEIDNQVNDQSIGSYQIIYHVHYGDMTVDVVRYVHVVSAQKNVRFIPKNALTTLKVGMSYQDPGCEVYVDDVLQTTCEVLSNNVNTTVKGVYFIEYGITIDGIQYTFKRYVFVMDNEFKLAIPFKKEEDISL